MTAEEAVNQYGSQVFVASKEDTLVSVCWQLYESNEGTLLRSLQLLNPSIRNWNSLKPGKEIRFLSEGNMREIFEI